MTDVHDKATRSHNMSRIRSKDTKPEMIVRRYLHQHGFRYRLHVKDLPGKPDLVLPKYKTVIFINGCFWHGHEDCKFFILPKTRSEWWATKINKNISNDARALSKLSEDGWKIIVVWECELKKLTKEESLLKLASKITD